MSSDTPRMAYTPNVVTRIAVQAECPFDVGRKGADAAVVRFCASGPRWQLQRTPRPLSPRHLQNEAAIHSGSVGQGLSECR